MPDPPDDPSDAPDLRREVPAILAMGALLVLSVAIALAVAPTYVAEEVQAFEDPQSLANPLWYLGLVIAFTVVVLFIAKRGNRRVIQGLFLLAILATLVYVLEPLLAQVPGAVGTNAFGIAGLAAVALTGLLVVHPEWYVIDTVGVAVGGGAAAIFGISLGLVPTLLLLVAFAAYDAIAVYRTKHMLDLADNVVTLRLPIVLVVPKGRGYSFLDEAARFREASERRAAVATDDEDRTAIVTPAPDDDGDGEGEDVARGPEAMIMGLGDVVIPSVLVVSAWRFLPELAGGAPVLGVGGPMVVALATLAGTLVGFTALMGLVLTGRPQAGLPTLNGGAILGFLAALLPLYGWAPLLP